MESLTKNSQYTDEYLSIIDELDGDIPSRRAAFAYMEVGLAVVHNKQVESSFVPRLFDERTYERMREIVEVTHGIVCKVINHYIDDPAYRSVFEFDPRLVELILLPRNYDSVLPFARFDTFLNEDTLEFGFCEFNADGSSGMNEDVELNKSIAHSATMQRFKERHHVRTDDLFNAWIDEFLAIYDTYAYKREQPRIAIVDYLGVGAVTAEFNAYARAFALRGYDCMVCDVRDLVFDGEVLRDKRGRRIDAIWRRCVTNDVLAYWDESQGLIDAVRAEKVALIGSFTGHLVHDKQIFDALYHPLTRAFLTEEEIAFVEASIPQTKFLDDKDVDIAEIRAHKDDWIIKPTDQYGSHDVYAGSMQSQESWDHIIDTYANGKAGAPFLVQRYIMPYKTKLLPQCRDLSSREDSEVPREVAWFNNLNGLYCMNGKFKGVFSRLGPAPIISEPLDDLTSATVWVDCE